MAPSSESVSSAWRWPVAERGKAQAAKFAVAEKPRASEGVPRFAARYQQEIAPALMKQFGYANRMAVPRLAKIVLNIGCGEAAHDAKVLEEAQRDLAIITGQRPAVTRAKKAVSNFKIKEGDPVGCKVTLRRARMYEFLDRLISAALPRIRDFRGLSAKGFDEAGNYSFGLTEQTIFPELHLDEVQYPLGMDVVIVTTAKNPKHSRALLQAFGMPFERDK
ncbi:MAG: 50S ribosomal protein L5 [Candidatus Omnitrophica bacterium]|nr:50S ribosomal protein L5 [Candidatus Omnitrophota bacterium]